MRTRARYLVLIAQSAMVPLKPSPQHADRVQARAKRTGRASIYGPNDDGKKRHVTCFAQ
jgi:hypothetical protein